jgi:hypothetical protein
MKKAGEIVREVKDHGLNLTNASGGAKATEGAFLEFSN